MAKAIKDAQIDNWVAQYVRRVETLEGVTRTCVPRQILPWRTVWGWNLPTGWELMLCLTRKGNEILVDEGFYPSDGV